MKGGEQRHGRQLRRPSGTSFPATRLRSWRIADPPVSFDPADQQAAPEILAGRRCSAPTSEDRLAPRVGSRPIRCQNSGTSGRPGPGGLDPSWPTSLPCRGSIRCERQSAGRRRHPAQQFANPQWAGSRDPRTSRRRPAILLQRCGRRQRCDPGPDGGSLHTVHLESVAHARATSTAKPIPGPFLNPTYLSHSALTLLFINGRSQVVP